MNNVSATPTTWEAAAEIAAQRIFEAAFPSEPKPEHALTWVRGDINRMRTRLFDFEFEDGKVTSDFVALGNHALEGVGKWHDWDYIDETLKLIAKKQHDYGHENIAAFGAKGLCVRLHDKAARLENLLARSTRQSALAASPDAAEATTFGSDRTVAQQAALDVSAMNEPITDTWADLLGYAIIGVMWCTGTFSLPLAADVVADTPSEPELTDEQRVYVARGLEWASMADVREECEALRASILEEVEKRVNTWVKHPTTPFFGGGSASSAKPFVGSSFNTVPDLFGRDIPTQREREIMEGINEMYERSAA